MTSVRRAWLLIPVAALVYPVAVLAGGVPRFPTRDECLRPPHAGRELEAVFGRFTRQPAAEALLGHVRGLGFKSSFLEVDSCGMLSVAVRGIPTVQAGHGLIAEARGVGLRPTLVTAPP